MQIAQLSRYKDLWGVIDAVPAGDISTVHYHGTKIEVLAFYVGMVGPMGEA